MPVPQFNHILNAHAAPTGEIDAGLHCKNHTLAQHVRSALADAGELMNGKPHAVTERMPKVVAMACVFDDVSGEGIRLISGHSFFDCRYRRFLRGQDDVIDAPKRVIRLADADGAREVGVITVDAGADVNDDGAPVTMGASDGRW